ncbi:hypothetical protein F5144DRAFT_150278 [Chaetomium tenue]|uniref:Uncharacterized protein n=1 Tax=Chaetomium tenue TaxID=1854479 RepID=A0ACB7PLN3_9PEZI|nr:hypothetical protein F5144DRAFT_150278 [Chaetomium globosum]
MPPPPPPPPPPPNPPTNLLPSTTNPNPNPIPPPPLPPRPPSTTLVSLLIYNGHPFADHWEYFVASPSLPHTHQEYGIRDSGTVIQAAGNVRQGFWLEVKRGWDLEAEVVGEGQAGRDGGRAVWKRVGLGWVGLGYFEGVGESVGNGNGYGNADGGGDLVEGVKKVFERGKDGEVVVEGVARCEFERALFKVPAPEKTLRTVDRDRGERNKPGKITQRNCQTWVVESAEQLVREGIFEQGVLDYLRATSIMTQP